MPSPPRNPSHLPIAHPEYRYPASGNPYWVRLRDFHGGLFLDNGPEALRGRWREHFDEALGPPRAGRRHLTVELGCNGGHVTLGWAARASLAPSPSQVFLGIDVKFKQIHRAWEKAEKRGLRNIVFARAHAERLRYLFAPGEIDRLCFYFPDPWPKKSQWKKRPMTVAWLREVAGLVRADGGEFHFKTDHVGYFEWFEERLAELEAADGPRAPWKVVEKTRDLHHGHPDPLSLEIPDVTLFEKLFIRDGLPIHSVRLART